MKISIIGLGLIGGSIAKTLSSSEDHQIFAFDINQSSIKNALDNKSIQFLTYLMENQQFCLIMILLHQST